MKVFLIPRNHEYIRLLKVHLEQQGVRVVLLKPFHYSSLSNIVKIIVFSARGFKIIHVHWLYIFPFRFIMKKFCMLCKILGIQIIWEMHNILPHGFTDRDRENSRWFFERANGIIFHSRSDIQRAKETYGTVADKPHIIIPHGNFNESYPNTITKESARERLSISASEKVILCFGHIRRHRGYEYLIDAVRDMRNTTVIIAGKVQDGDIYQSLQAHKKVLPHIKLYVGWIPDSEVQLYFNACDIVVLPYTAITTSGVIPLAYAFSRPVITSDIGGIKDVVNDDTGMLVPPMDSEALKKAIGDIFTKDLQSMGDRAQDFAKKAFSWTSNAKKLKEFYMTMGYPEKQKKNKKG
jgi:glycosyltransferase involved in cell wall biosynthesis